MIQANDLRIGNWVNSHSTGKPAKIIRLDTDTPELLHKPIPLTSSILKGCGFEFYAIGHNDFDLKGNWFRGGFVLNEYTDGSFGFEWGEEGSVRDVASLHHLQNLYYSVTGGEFEVNP